MFSSRSRPAAFFLFRHAFLTKKQVLVIVWPVWSTFCQYGWIFVQYLSIFVNIVYYQQLTAPWMQAMQNSITSLSWSHAWHKHTESASECKYEEEIATQQHPPLELQPIKRHMTHSHHSVQYTIIMIPTGYTN